MNYYNEIKNKLIDNEIYSRGNISLEILVFNNCSIKKLLYLLESEVKNYEAIV